MALEMLDIIGQLADMKEIDCKNTTALAVLIELLIEKGYFSKQEWREKAQQLEAAAMADIVRQHRYNLFGAKKTR